MEGPQITREAIKVDAIPDVVRLRSRVSWFFVCLLWAHVPLIAAMAAYNHTNLIVQLSIASALALTASLAVRIARTAPATRLIVALMLTGEPILIVYNGTGPWQIDYHMYFFAIFAMLVAYCDWRPIVAAASLTAVHHLIFDLVDPARVFPTEGGLGRVALHAGIVAVEGGVLIWIVCQLRRLFLEFATTRQVAERALARAAEVSHLRHAASHDELTGAVNRGAFIDQVEASLARAAIDKAFHCAVLFLDLNDFKAVNDRFGHAAGDALLAGFARRLDRCIRPQDTVARFGGDEFAVLVDEIDDIVAAKVVAERILASVKAPFEFDGVRLSVSVSIGIAYSDAGYADPQAMLRDADTAMYRVKRFADQRMTYATFGDFGDTGYELPRVLVRRS